MMSIFVTDCKNILKINLGYVVIKHINVSETTGSNIIVKNNWMYR